MFPYILNLIGREKMWLISIFSASQWKKNKIFWLTMPKGMALISEQKTVAGMWLI